MEKRNLWLKGFPDNSTAVFEMNGDIFDPNNLEPEYVSRAVRINGSADFDYYTSPEGDSIAPARLTSYIIKCQVPGSGPEFDETTIFGKFSADRDSLFAMFIYRDGAHRDMVLGSCNVLFTR